MRNLANAGRALGARGGKSGRFGQRPSFVSVGAAPHLPAGILSPYSDGERGSLAVDFANLQRCREDTSVAASPLLPVTIRGEVPGR
ncbi:hypothetical protein EN827_19165 [Mesorhizobium sp. M1D.F.Ca.ET.184.01.1.1]|nr:hypothetical protein EN874_020790 [Mesorhizobium sp. M1D.F.Ca.ET.231.01.1.1]TGP30303.1 hypothetical protein EN877_19170 [Mesorhizobium sp. M1D.F.Ca.ET.234.01.1.1]TGS44379.1 hypothetical protein EN827_19165 [Mesorhizobium sp. M1D.F.Ca.ET.184.01.1.1]TGS60419.1 hypothetical protein EN826_019165 [Mesorhizobium sp. M1D.F.Ca.ET.183.01.1.1]